MRELKVNDQTISDCNVHVVGNRNSICGMQCQVTGDCNIVTGMNITVRGNNNILNGMNLTAVGTGNIDTGMNNKLNPVPTTSKIRKKRTSIRSVPYSNCTDVIKDNTTNVSGNGASSSSSSILNGSNALNTIYGTLTSLPCMLSSSSLHIQTDNGSIHMSPVPQNWKVWLGDVLYELQQDDNLKPLKKIKWNYGVSAAYTYLEGHQCSTVGCTNLTNIRINNKQYITEKINKEQSTSVLPENTIVLKLAAKASTIELID